MQTQARETAFNSMNISGGWQAPWKHGGVVLDENGNSVQPRTGQGEGVSAIGLHVASPSGGDAKAVRWGVV